MTLDPDRRLIVEGFRGVRLSKKEFRAVAAIVGRKGGLATFDWILTAVYDGDDEPENARGCLKVMIHRVHRKMLALGATDRIEAVPGEGYVYRAGVTTMAEDALMKIGGLRWAA